MPPGCCSRYAAEGRVKEIPPCDTACVQVDPGAVGLVGREFGRSALHAAAGSGSAQIVRQLLMASADANLRDSLKMTAMHVACSVGATEVVEVLLEFDARHDIADHLGNSALHCAAQLLDAAAAAACLRLLVEAGASFDATNNSGQRPIDCCAFPHIRRMFVAWDRLRWQVAPPGPSRDV
jgi:hypothetical protein